MILNVFRRSCLPLLACSLCRLATTLAHSWLSSCSPSRSLLRKLCVRVADEEVSGLLVDVWEKDVAELGVELGDDDGVFLSVNEVFGIGCTGWLVGAAL